MRGDPLISLYLWKSPLPVEPFTESQPWPSPARPLRRTRSGTLFLTELPSPVNGFLPQSEKTTLLSVFCWKNSPCLMLYSSWEKRQVTDSVQTLSFRLIPYHKIVISTTATWFVW